MKQTVPEKTPRVRLELDSRPESVTLVRGMLAGVGETLAFDAELVDDLKTAVSEACNNVVIHAYGDRVGVLAVDVEIGTEQLEVSVSDKGAGIRGVASTADRMGVGLAVISALTKQVSFSSRPGGGTEVRMAFATGSLDQPLPAAVSLNGGAWVEGLDGPVVVRLAPTELLGGVLGRIARAIAGRARFSVDRLSDLYPVTAALASHAEKATADGRIGFSIETEDRHLELTLGPFNSGSGERLVAAFTEKADEPLSQLVDEVIPVPHDNWELLRVVMTDHRPH